MKLHKPEFIFFGILMIIIAIFMIILISLTSYNEERISILEDYNYPNLQPSSTLLEISIQRSNQYEYIKIAYPYRTFQLSRVSNTGSMRPAISDNSTLILIPPTEEEIKIGDIIIFNCTELNEVYAHRIIDIIEFENYTKSYITKGDNNREIDFLCRTTFDDIKSQVVGIIY